MKEFIYLLRWYRYHIKNLKSICDKCCIAREHSSHPSSLAIPLVAFNKPPYEQALVGVAPWGPGGAMLYLIVVMSLSLFKAES